ncbi:MAG: STAS domain-containing protein [Anaerolineae bacterium]|nr:STAS domain-containing protein [Anaerolineae bacterium]
MLAYLNELLDFFTRPIQIVRQYKPEFLRPDLLAGLTIGIIMLPQAIAFALVAELPPRVGLYTAIVGSIVGGFWGSSNQLQTGPTNTTSLLVLSILLTIATPGSPEYLAAAGMMVLMVGVFRIVMGLAHLGILVNFVSDSVIVGFTSGAGTLILISQIRHLLRLDIPSLPNLWQTLPSIVSHLPTTHWPSALIGIGTIALVTLLRKINRKLPAPLIAMITAGVIVALFGLDAQGVYVVGELPRELPPLSKLPLSDWKLAGKLFTGALAVAAVGLVEAMSIARSIASQTGQRLDSNQEFIGQGLANIACAFLSGYTCSGSFTRSAINYEAGAKTSLSSVFGGFVVLIAMLALAPLAAYVPLSALAGVLILIAYGLIDCQKITRIWHSTNGDRTIMTITALATLALPLQYAVLTGIVVSLITYLIRTSTPRIHTVLPDETFRHLIHQPDKEGCLQLSIIEILGDLYFGATNHVETHILDHLQQNPDQRFLLLRMQTVEHCDISGIHALESIVRAYRERGGDVYLSRIRQTVLELIKASGFHAYLGEDHFLDQDHTISYLFYRVLDPAICIYECPVRAFRECQNLPKRHYPNQVHLDAELPADSIPLISAQALWEELRTKPSPWQVIDVREPREFQQGHIPLAEHIPLAALSNHIDQVSHERPVVMVCQGGRRSMKAAAWLLEQGYDNVQALQGGMIAWRQCKLLEAVRE